MKNYLPFRGNGKFYKGNLHCHSTVSDGKFTPEELVRMYREHGYSFLGLSEHEIYTDRSDLNTEDFLIIPAIECSVASPEGGKCYHIHGIKGPGSIPAKSQGRPLMNGEILKKPEEKGIAAAQKVIDNLTDAGNLVMINHPLWSFNELEDLLGLKGYFAVEIFNYGCEMENKTGLATVYWDSLLRRGIKVWGVAADDNHNRDPFGGPPCDWDSFGGWVCVKADSLSVHSIADALQKGRFYSSSGPEIYDYGIRDGVVFAECSEVDRIYFLTYEGRGFVRYAKNGGTITSATYPLKGYERYVRIECQDAYGRTAWTNPIFLE